MPKLKKLVCQFLLLCSSATSLAFASNNNHFEQTIADLGNSEDMLGLAVAVVRDGKVSLVKTYGIRQAGRVDKITPKTSFRIASLSKAFAATVAVQLEFEEKLSLDDSVSDYNQDFRLKSSAEAERASLNHVLSHRLSLPPYAYDNLLESGTPPKKILNQMRQVDPICKVGSCYAYQNVGFNMITSAIEVADMVAYEDSVRTRLFEPIGMLGASFGQENLKASGNWAQSHQRYRGGPWRPIEVKQAYYNVPAAGGVNASIDDMAKWLAAQMGNKPLVLSQTALTRLHTPQTKTQSELRRMRHMSKVTEAHYGLGWRVYKYAGMQVVNHSGSVEGYGAQIAFLPERNVGLVLLTNSKSRAFWKILPSFLNQELGLLED